MTRVEGAKAAEEVAREVALQAAATTEMEAVGMGWARAAAAKVRRIPVPQQW